MESAILELVADVGCECDDHREAGEHDCTAGKAEAEYYGLKADLQTAGASIAALEHDADEIDNDLSALGDLLVEMDCTNEAKDDPISAAIQVLAAYRETGPWPGKPVPVLEDDNREVNRDAAKAMYKRWSS